MAVSSVQRLLVVILLLMLFLDVIHWGWGPY